MGSTSFLMYMMASKFMGPHLSAVNKEFDDTAFGVHAKTMSQCEGKQNVLLVEVNLVCTGGGLAISLLGVLTQCQTQAPANKWTDVSIHFELLETRRGSGCGTASAKLRRVRTCPFHMDPLRGV